MQKSMFNESNQTVLTEMLKKNKKRGTSFTLDENTIKNIDVLHKNIRNSFKADNPNASFLKGDMMKLIFENLKDINDYNDFVYKLKRLQGKD